MGNKDERSLRERTVKRLAATRMMSQRSQEDLARELGTSKSSISRIESGRQNVSVDYIEAIAQALGMQAEFKLEEPGIEYGDTSVYSLKLYDEELVRFEMKRDIGLPIRILEVNEARRDVFPLDLEVSEDGLRRWMEKRTIPKNRENVGSILYSLGLGITDLKGIIDICMGLSLNDSYWVPQTEFDGTFAEYNLYQNRFDAALSLIAYLGRGSRVKNYGTTPELTTGGMLRKSWRFSERKGIWLYKSGTDGFANAGNEPYSEFLAYQVAEQMGLHAVPYELENYYGILASKCPLFTDIDTSYVPIGRIVRTGGIEACLEYYRELGDDFYQELASMLVFDAVIVNEDRHFGNFGVLRDNHSGRILSPAPIFDNGLSLLAYGMKKDFTEDADFERYLASRTNPYGIGNQFMELARRVMGPTQRAQLRRLIGFEFTESDLTNLPRWRITRLERMIRERVKELLEG